MTPGYAELCVTSNFTFLTGASHPEELVTRAAELGLAAIAITDRNSLAGVVRAYRALQILREEAAEAVQIRSQHRVDSCSRQEIGTPQDIPRPEVLRLPRLIVGCRLVLRDSPVEWIALPTDLAAYQRLSRLLTLGKRRAGKGDCHLDLADLLAEEKTPADVIDALYLRAISRTTTAEEKQKLLAVVETSDNPKDALEDIFWAILNSREFLFLK